MIYVAIQVGKARYIRKSLLHCMITTFVDDNKLIFIYFFVNNLGLSVIGVQGFDVIRYRHLS